MPDPQGLTGPGSMIRLMADTESVRIGISSCLLGQKVRFDGGHKRDAFLVDTFGAFVEWVPVCPEVELGLGTPREALRLVRKADEIPHLRIARPCATKRRQLELRRHAWRQEGTNVGLRRDRFDRRQRRQIENGLG